MREVIPNAPAAGGKARAGLSKEEIARFFGPPPLKRLRLPLVGISMRPPFLIQSQARRPGAARPKPAQPQRLRNETR